MKTIKLDNIPVEVALLIKKMESLDKDEERLDDEIAKINADRRELKKELRTVCNHPEELVVVKRRWDPGDPGKCPVWQFHQIYSTPELCNWAKEGCTTASIGCLQCKQPVIDAVTSELKPIQERAAFYEEQPDVVRNIINEGCEKARETARDTMDEVRHAMSLT